MANDQQQLDAPPQVSSVAPDTKERVLTGVGGFLSGATGQGKIYSPLEQAIQAHNQRRLDEANLHMKTMSTVGGGLAMINQGVDPETHQHFDDPNYNGRGRDTLLSEYGNNYETAKKAFHDVAGVNKDTKAALQRNQAVIDHIVQTGGKVSAPPQASAAGGGPAPAASPAAGSATPSTNLTPPPTASAPAAPSASGGPAAPPSASPAPAIAADGTATSGGGAKIVGAAGPAMTTPAQPQVTTKSNVTPTMQDSAMDLAMQNPARAKQINEATEDARQYALFKRKAETEHEYKMLELREAQKARMMYSSGRASALAPISMNEVRKMADKGMSFQAADGATQLDPANYDDTMMFVPLQINGRIVGYSPASQKQTHLTYNNEVIAVPQYNQMQAAEGQGTVLGAKNVPVTTTHTAPGITLSGDIGPVTTSTTRTSQGGPATPGPTGGAPTATTPAAPRQPKPGTRLSSPPVASNGTGTDKAIPFAAANTLNQRIVPVREAASQILGDPTRPEMQSLKDFAAIADNPAESKALANAVKLTFDGLSTEEHQAGGLATLLKNYGGVPQAVLDSQNEIRQKVIGTLSPRNQEAYSAIMASYGTMIGLRSLTKASAAKFSTEALERELPIPGLNSFSSADYYNKLSHIAEEVRNGSRTLPLPKDEKDYYDRQVGEFRDKATGKGGAADLTKLTPEARKWIADHAAH